MNTKTLSLFLGLQLFAMVWAGLVFRVIEPRLLAGALAGAYFVVSGIYMVTRAVVWPDKWRSFLWYPLLLHVFGISIPMVTFRFYQWTQGFEQIQILGLPAPVFHQLSTVVFAALVIATAIDRFRLGRSATL